VSVTGFRLLGERTVHTGHVWKTVVATFEAPDGSAFERDVVRSPGAVAAVPVLEGDGGRSVVLVAQYRPAVERMLIEIPAGMRDVADEPLEVTAERELAEEVGLRPAQLELLAEIYPSVGMTDQVTTIFLATGCAPVARAPHGPEEEHSEIITIALGEAVEWVLSGRIADAKSVAGLLLAERWLRR
jgi:8-oxo-dGTP pyrophosphatase MutT (NUDIX family)